jgi:hypothetical protein
MQEKRHDILESKNDIPSISTIFSSQKIQMDYVTLRGIETRTGVKRDDLYALILREFLDNALDYSETYCLNTTPQVNVTITKEENDSLLRIIVRNSVDASNNITLFSKGMLQYIYDFGGYFSSKRIRKISRGALGDASKLVLGIPYALARDMNWDISNWNQLLTIKSNSSNNNLLQTFHIRLSMDRFNDKMEPEITTSDTTTTNTSKYTEFGICLPLSHGDFLIDRRLSRFLQNYALLNAHIGFTFNLFGRTPIQYLATQPKINNGKNISSIYYYNLSEFQDFIYELHDNIQIVYDVLYKTFREAKALPKSQLTQMTVSQLKQLPTADGVKEVYEQLRKVMSPISNKIGLTPFLPFNTNKSVRRKAIEDRLNQAGIYFEKPIKYKQIHGYHKEVNGVEFPYFFEIAVIHSDSYCLSNNLEVIQSINSTTTPNKNNEIFGRSFEYVVGNTRWTNATIFNIFDNYGYIDNVKKCKKPNSMIIVNLISPVVNYKNFSKSQIDVSPFADDIAERTIKACKGGGGPIPNGKPGRKDVLKEILEERRDKWFALDEISRQKHWWTMSDVFYATRKRLIDYGYTNEEIKRDYITGLIKEKCEYELEVKREEIGIIAADRAQLYFKGEWKDVGLKEIDKLIQYGTDMLIIEKEGIAEQLALFADDKGIALLNTRGFLTEYASILSTKSEKQGCNIAILTDFDASGLVVAAKVACVYRVGIDFETLDDLELDIEHVEEVYEPKTHLNTLKFGGEHADIYPDEMVDYVSQKRVEINSVITALDDNKKFWEWIVEKLRKQFHKRDYNRSVNIPEYVKPKCLEKLEDILKEKGTTILEIQREGLEKRLSNIKNGFLFDRTNKVLPDYNIEKYEEGILEQSQKIIENNSDMKPLLEKIEDIVIEEELEG